VGAARFTFDPPAAGAFDVPVVEPQIKLVTPRSTSQSGSHQGSPADDEQDEGDDRQHDENRHQHGSLLAADGDDDSDDEPGDTDKDRQSGDAKGGGGAQAFGLLFGATVQRFDDGHPVFDAADVFL